MSETLPVDQAGMSASDYGDYLVSKMDERDQSGSLVRDSADLQRYAIWYFGSIIAWFIVNYFLRLFF